jgi:hypothetical protein
MVTAVGREANRLFIRRILYDAAALHFWRAVLLHNNSPTYRSEGFENLQYSVFAATQT